MKSKLLVIELWGIGDLMIAGAFLRAAAEKFEVTLLAKPYALELKSRFWPHVNIIPFVPPWTSFRQKYNLLQWPWKDLRHHLHHLRESRFEIAASGRWDPRDHFLLWLISVPKRLGFPRLGSQMFLTEALTRPPPLAHRYEYWRLLGDALSLSLPLHKRAESFSSPTCRPILVHSGAAQPVRVWPLERYRGLVARLRELGYRVQVGCDRDQRAWWLERNETEVATPGTITELIQLVEGSGAFIGNDSGSGHLAAACGVPTFTVFGPQLPEWFAPLHPAADWIEGAPCPYKPCFDSCRYPVAHCLVDLDERAVWQKVERFMAKLVVG